jgi:nucleoside-diphosphate-sugar epimerase
VLGGSSFVGRAVVEEALRRGWAVTTFNRGSRTPADPGVQQVLGDRLLPATLEPLRSGRWELVVDTWSGAPAAARDSAAVLARAADRYAYISSESVYAPPPPVGGDESAPTVDASPDAADGEYAELKRGAELAIEAVFGHRALLARPGLILGPREDVGRLPWWLLRLDRGGEVLAPGPVGRPLQYIDARDLAAWVLDAVLDGLAGPYNVVSRSGYATMGSLLEACRSATGSDATLTWVDPDVIERAGIEPWTELPIWLPPDHEFRGMHESSVERAHAAGLRCRPLEETVRDTWAWLVETGRRPPLRADVPAPGMDPTREREVLAALHAQAR